MLASISRPLLHDDVGVQRAGSLDRLQHSDDAARIDLRLVQSPDQIGDRGVGKAHHRVVHPVGHFKLAVGDDQAAHVRRVAAEHERLRRLMIDIDRDLHVALRDDDACDLHAAARDPPCRSAR